MGIEFIRDEADKKMSVDPLGVTERPGYKRRWVRTKGHAAEAHVERMRRLGYEPVAADQADMNVDVRRKAGRPKKLDGTIQYDDVMLCEIPIEQHEEYRAAQQALTKRRTGDVGKKFVHENPGTFDETRVSHKQEE